MTYSTILKMKWPWTKLKERRERFLSERLGVSVDDEQFVKKVFGDPSEIKKRIAVLLRRVIAREMGVPTEKIHPNESNNLLCSLMGVEGFWGCLFGGPYGFDMYSVIPQLVWLLEREFGTRAVFGMAELQMVACFEKGSEDGCENGNTFSQWIKEAAQEVQSILESRHYDFHVDELNQELQSKECEPYSTQFFSEWSLILGIFTFFLSFLPVIGSIAILISPIGLLFGTFGFFICIFQRDHAGVGFAIVGLAFCALTIGNCMAINNAFYKFFLQ